METEHHWVVTCSVEDPTDVGAPALEVKIIVPGEDIISASKQAQSLLLKLGLADGTFKFVHITPHFFTDQTEVRR